MVSCPECDANLSITIKKEDSFYHIIELCSYCAYTKAYVDYLDSDTGEINWSGLEH